MKSTKKFSIMLLLSLAAVGLGGCGDGDSSTSTTPSHNTSSTSTDEDSGLMIGSNGQIKPGIDMGDDLSLGYDGKVGVSFP